VPRHLFVEPDQIDQAYGPGTLPTESEHTISGADHVALMTGLLQVRPGDRVLEVVRSTWFVPMVHEVDDAND
jgi:protein-L-isoaspartate(D-aspartate) O-methyltransferase